MRLAQRCCIGWTVALALAAAAIAMLVLSFATVPINYVGLDYNELTFELSRTPHAAGRRFLGIGHSYQLYPSTLRSIEFSNSSSHLATPTTVALNCRTVNGLDVTVDVSFQYLLDTARLYQLATTFGPDYEGTYLRVARSVLRDIASNFTSHEFFSERVLISNAMHAHLNTTFWNTLFASVPLFQLASVALPASFNNILAATEAARTDITRAAFEQTNRIVQLQTERQQAVASARVAVVAANATAESLRISNAALATSRNVSITAEADAVYSLRAGSGLQGAELVALLSVQFVAARRDAELVVGAPLVSLPDPTT